MEFVRWVFFAFSIVFTSAMAAERNWAALATEDVDAAYAVALTDHPGSADERNREFLDIAKDARSDALSKGRQARNLVQYRQALMTFFGAFEDYHFTVTFPDGARRCAG